MMLAFDQELIVAAVPLNVTPPWLDPKLVPVIVTEVPIGPDVGDKLEMLGAGTTVKLTPLLATPPTVTTTLPVVAPVGTVAVMLAAPQELVLAVVPLNCTVPALLPKFEPAITMDDPTAPLFGVRLVMLGALLPLLVVLNVVMS